MSSTWVVYVNNCDWEKSYISRIYLPVGYYWKYVSVEQDNHGEGRGIFTIGWDGSSRLPRFMHLQKCLAEKLLHIAYCILLIACCLLLYTWCIFDVLLVACRRNSNIPYFERDWFSFSALLPHQLLTRLFFLPSSLLSSSTSCLLVSVHKSSSDNSSPLPCRSKSKGEDWRKQVKHGKTKDIEGKEDKQVGGNTKGER